MGPSAFGACAGRIRRQFVAVFIGVVLAASMTAAQRSAGGGFNRRPVLAYATAESMDTGAFQFCRLVFRQAANGDGHGWSVDFPRADENLSIRFSELTRAPISVDESGKPNHVLIRLTQAELFRCPFVMMTEPGGAYFDDREASALRDYVLKGGFFWADDFWGEYAWQVWESQLRKALPSGQYRIVDLALDHPIFHMLMNVPEIPQIPGLGVWLSTGGTSERGADSAVPHVRAINDERGRIMVLMTHNSDYGDGFEEEASDRSYFERFSVRAYGFGVNTLIYSMTH